MSARLQFVATDLAGVSVGEILNAKDKRASVGLNRMSVGSFKVRLDNPLADQLLACEALIKVYLDGTLLVTANVTQAEEVGSGSEGQEKSVAVNFAGPLWRLNRRIIGIASAVYLSGTPLAPLDKSVLMGNIIDYLNGVAYTGLDKGTITNVGSTSFLEYSYKKALEALTELAQGVSAPDFRVRASEPAAVAGGVRMGYFDVAPAFGAAKNDAVFEYGIGRHNVADYKRQVSLDGMANAIYLPVTDVNEPTQTEIVVTDATSIAKWGRVNDVLQSDLRTQALRQQFADEHLRVRKNPRQIITFQPTRDDPVRPGRVPQYGTDFTIGDTLPFRAVQNGVVRVNAQFRLYNIDLSANDQGEVMPSFTLITD